MDNHFVAVSIENPGADIASDHIPHLFDRFYRIDPSRSQSGEGAGLGLAITKSIIEAHRGSISVTSVNGITRFDIKLPAADADTCMPPPK
jgi:two-component system heavy metal sensor histidine kinase CusS